MQCIAFFAFVARSIKIWNIGSQRSASRDTFTGMYVICALASRRLVWEIGIRRAFVYEKSLTRGTHSSESGVGSIVVLRTGVAHVTFIYFVTFVANNVIARCLMLMPVSPDAYILTNPLV